MLIWCDFIEGFIFHDEVNQGLGLFGFMNDEHDQLGYIYVGY
jgi:hypothetical protein